MSFLNKIADVCVCEQRKKVNVGKIVFKTVAITAAVLAFVPTVFVKRGDGFDGYGLLSRVSYKKSKNDEGKEREDIFVTLVDLGRYGIGNKKETVEEENEDSISIEE